MDRAFTRREFLGSSLMLASASLAAPSFVQASALALPRASGARSSLAGVPQDRILVVIQLSGGNDGLNTVVPYGFDPYHRARPGIAVPHDQAIPFKGVDGVGLHPALAPIKELYDDARCAVIQGVGYPNPNRSHFKSMDIWHTADLTASNDGWLGRYFDAECCGTGKGESGSAESMPGIAIGRSAPLAMQGRRAKAISFESAELFRWTARARDEKLTAAYDSINRRGGDAGVETNASFLLRTALDAQVASDTIRSAVSKSSLVEYPNGELSAQLQLIASMIRAGLPTRVYYATLGGFDTHAGQGSTQGRHSQLLGQFARAVAAFQADLKAQENDGRVLTIAFSEFGRRVAQNASQGTDHGTAAPMFLFGPMVRPGVIGDHPSLSDLDDGDLKHSIDFRGVYAGVLEQWMKADAKAILEADFKPVLVVKKA